MPRDVVPVVYFEVHTAVISVVVSRTEVEDNRVQFISLLLLGDHVLDNSTVLSALVSSNELSQIVLDVLYEQDIISSHLSEAQDFTIGRTDHDIVPLSDSPWMDFTSEKVDESWERVNWFNDFIHINAITACKHAIEGVSQHLRNWSMSN